MIGLICCYGLIFQTLRNKIVASHNFFHELGRIHRHLAEDTAIYDRPFRRCLSAKRYANSNDRPTDRKIAWLLGIACRHNAAEALVAIDLTMLGCALCPIARAGPATIPRSPILKLEATLFRTADKAAAEAYVR
jgi:hypothetical protein